MKKLLALVLALVMTLGLATVSSSAAYSDEADVSLNEAVEVMSAVGVFQGSDGKFSPKENLTREQAAKLIAYLDLGETAAEALPGVKVFDDVAADRWSAKYIAYCQEAGYIAGDGTGKFNPTGELTGYAFGKMVLCVLGYDAAIEGFTGNTWSINVAKLMEKNDIADSIDSAASLTLTREQAAQYCFNALKATMVEYESKGTKVTINGAEIATGASKAAEATTGTAKTGVAIKNDETGVGTGKYYLQLGEKLYKGDLYRDTTKTDDAGHPATVWYYGPNHTETQYKVGAYADSADLRFVVSSKSDNLATLYGQLHAKNSKYKVGNGNGVTALTADTDFDTVANSTSTANSAKSPLYFNGVDETVANLGAYAPQKGDVIEVYVDDDDANLISSVVITRYVLEKVDKVDTNVSTADKNNDVTAYINLKGVVNSTGIKDTDVAGYNAATYVKGAYVATAFKYNDNSNVVDSYVLTPAAEGTVSARSGNDFTVNSTKYVAVGANFKSEWNANDYTGTYAIYTTADNYALGIIEIEAGKSVADAYYVTKLWTSDSDGDYSEETVTTKAQLVGMDGTVKTVTIGYTTTSGKIYGVVPTGSLTGTLYNWTESGTGTYYVKNTDGLPATTTTNAYSTSKKYAQSAFGIAAGTLVTLTEHKSDAYTTLVAYNGDSTYENDVTVSLADGTEIKETDTRIGGYYVSDKTQYIIVDGSGSSIKVTTKTGSLSYKNNTGNTVTATVVYEKDGKNNIAGYVIIPSEYKSAASKDVLYLADYDTSFTDDGDVMTVVQPDGTRTTILVDKGAGAGFADGENMYYTYTVDSDGIYDLTAVTDVFDFSADITKWSTNKPTGAAYKAIFDSAYNGTLSVKSGASTAKYISGIDAKDVIVIDGHTTDNDAYQVKKAKDAINAATPLEPGNTTNATANRITYAGTISSLDDLASLDSAYTALVSLYVTEDGVQTLFVLDVYK